MKSLPITFLTLLFVIKPPAITAQDKDIFDAARDNDVAVAKLLIADHADIDNAAPTGSHP
jgi:hypothetical protein